ncbi:hypothetical protein [Devosia sp.]|uniref:phage tail assembly chaperone n=1 Tax=Devosia sp. TaxID=1871048 RepID=UPI001AD4D6EC|nr:hypothetical protein [Devosia sp.]MBN9333632.1 hypothetical protein [Devosia sp.]
MRHKAVIDYLERQLDGKPGPFPDVGRLAWRWFNDLCRTRTSNGYGPNPLSYSEIEAYARLYRWSLEARHVDMILAMDRVWMEHARGGEGGISKTGSTPGMEMTPEAFDAVFG